MSAGNKDEKCLCPKNHFMKYLNKGDKKIENNSCDICNIYLAKINSGSLRCEECDYDKCDICI